MWFLTNVTEDDCEFLGVHMRLSTRCKIWFTLGLLFFSKITSPFPENSHHECALQLAELWNTSLLFDLNYKYINGSLAFSPG